MTVRKLLVEEYQRYKTLSSILLTRWFSTISEILMLHLFMLFYI